MLERILRWESDKRYYTARIHTDLLGDLVVERAWGGLYNRKGKLIQEVVPSLEAAEAAIADIAARRSAHHYSLVFDRGH